MNAFKLSYMQGWAPVEPENFLVVPVGNVRVFPVLSENMRLSGRTDKKGTGKNRHFQPKPPGNFPVQLVPVPVYMLI